MPLYSKCGFLGLNKTRHTDDTVTPEDLEGLKTYCGWFSDTPATTTDVVGLKCGSNKRWENVDGAIGCKQYCDPDTQYESTPPTATSDRVCTGLTNCGSDEYMSVSKTPTSDRVCTTLTTCGLNEYESTPPTETSDRACAQKMGCVKHTWAGDEHIEGCAGYTTSETCPTFQCKWRALHCFPMDGAGELDNVCGQHTKSYECATNSQCQWVD